MSIAVVCPNGHSLSVREECAGKTGLCPVCRARVVIPESSEAGLSDDEIVGILGPHDPNRSRGFRESEADAVRPTASVHFAARKVIVGGAKADGSTKTCDKCSEEIPASTHICPYCHTYVGGSAKPA